MKTSLSLALIFLFFAVNCYSTQYRIVKYFEDYVKYDIMLVKDIKSDKSKNEYFIVLLDKKDSLSGTNKKLVADDSIIDVELSGLKKSLLLEDIQEINRPFINSDGMYILYVPETNDSNVDDRITIEWKSFKITTQLYESKDFSKKYFHN